MTAIRLDLLEWQTHGPAHRDYRLAGVSLADQPVLSALAASLTQRDMLSVQEFRQGLEISTTSYVGRLRLGDLVVSVRPKILLIQLMRLMRYAYGLRHLHRFDPASFETEPDGFLDLLLLQLTAEVGEIVERGLHRRYVRTAEDLATPKGRIDFQGLARRRDVAAVTLPCVWERTSLLISSCGVPCGAKRPSWPTRSGTLPWTRPFWGRLPPRRTGLPRPTARRWPSSGCWPRDRG